MEFICETDWFISLPFLYDIHADVKTGSGKIHGILALLHAETLLADGKLFLNTEAK